MDDRAFFTSYLIADGICDTSNQPINAALPSSPVPIPHYTDNWTPENTQRTVLRTLLITVRTLQNVINIKQKDKTVKR